MSQPWPPLYAAAPDTAGTPESEGSLSPRTSLLSAPYGPDVDDAPRRIPRGPTLKFRHERERAHSTASPRDLLDLLVNEEYESRQTRKVLYTAFDRLELETRRADAAEARIEEVVQRARAINDARVSAQQQALRAQDELKLYKMQLDNAQKEILRAQDVLKAIEAQRDEAEAAAVSARSKARRLNEERLIEAAREEGRRLGFEEGVRRGRRIGYREAYDAAGADEQRDGVREITAVVDRLIESHNGPEQIEIAEDPRSVPPPSTARTAPEVHRVETPANSSLENQRHSSRGRRDSDNASRSTVRRPPEPVIPAAPSVAEPRIIPTGTTPVPSANSRTSRAPSDAPSWLGGVPISIQNSPPTMRHPEISVIPDNYIPTADASHNIVLPPPHEMQRSIPSPSPSQRTLGANSERPRSNYMYDNHPQRRASPVESLASTKQSAASTISQLDIVGLPGRHTQGLSVIHEDASMRSDYSQTIASTPQAGRDSFRERRSSDTLRGKSKQQLADELRYSDPATAEQWRRQAESSRSQPPPNGPPRPRPAYVSVPTPLSPPRDSQRLDPRYQRTPIERQGRSETRSDYRDQRRPLSSDSSVPEINVEPPSRSPSDAPSRRENFPERGLLSPDHAHQPLPIPAPPVRSSAPVIPAVPSSPVTGHEQGHGHFYAAPPPVPFPTRDPQGPVVIPQGNPSAGGGGGGGGVPRYAVPPRTSSDREGQSRPRTPVSFYATSPVPTGVTYPAPPISRSATYSNSYPGTAGSATSVTSDGGGGGGRRRRDSMGASTAGMTPASRMRPIGGGTVNSVDSAGGSVRNRRQSNGSSLPAYPRYDPDAPPVDPAYFARNDSVGGRSAGRGYGPAGSPGYGYATLRE